MQKSIISKWNNWLLPIVLILFILQIIMLPWTIGFTLADRSDRPENTLTYTENKLTWDSAAGIQADGSAKIDFFSDKSAKDMKSSNGDKLIAPGTGKDLFIRLKNAVKGSVTYTAVLYEIQTDHRIPVEASLDGENVEDTADYSLPNGVKEDHVVRAITGSLDGGRVQDFDISWHWDYEESTEQDATDTKLGDHKDVPEVTLGFYLIVEDNNTYVTPDVPKTGDNAYIGLYFGLMLLSFIVLLLLLWDRRREAKREGN